MPKCLTQNKYKVDLTAELKSTKLDIHELFRKFNTLFFDDAIDYCEIKWVESDDHKEKENQHHNNHSHKNGTTKPAKKRKKYAAHYSKDSSGFCCISLEKSILRIKSNKYVIETILHHMIHCYILLQSPCYSTESSKSEKHQKSRHSRVTKSESFGHSDHFMLIADTISKRSGPHIKITTNNKQCRQNDDFPSEIIPNQLYLGNIHHALNLKVLRSLGITHIVNCTQSIENKFHSKGIGYCRVPVNDKSSESILHYFVKAIRFIEKVRGEATHSNDSSDSKDSNHSSDAVSNHSNRIMIHCHAGISRSSTITIAYLMFSWKMTMFDAIAHVQSKRYQIQPNQGFKNQLLDFYLYLEQNEGNLDDFERIYKPTSPVQQPRNSYGDDMLEAACLPYAQLINGNSDNDIKTKPNKKRNSTKEHVACPVCGRFFRKNMINTHLDGCIE